MDGAHNGEVVQVGGDHREEEGGDHHICCRVHAQHHRLAAFFAVVN